MLFPKFDLMKLYYQSNQDGGALGGIQNSSNVAEDNKEQQETIDSFEAWVAKQPKDIQSVVQPLFDAHIEKLKNTVKATRDERDTLQQQLRDIAKKASEGKVDKAEVEKISAQLDEANRKSDFYEEAPSYQCHNVKAAYAVAVANDLFTKAGLPDWKRIQEEVPELFGKPTPKGPIKRTAGAGVNQEQPKSTSINDWIRKEAGSGTIAEI